MYIFIYTNIYIYILIFLLHPPGDRRFFTNFTEPVAKCNPLTQWTSGREDWDKNQLTAMDLDPGRRSRCKFFRCVTLWNTCICLQEKITILWFFRKVVFLNPKVTNFYHVWKAGCTSLKDCQAFDIFTQLCAFYTTVLCFC